MFTQTFDPMSLLTSIDAWLVAIVGYFLYSLVRPIVFPKVLRFPWPIPSDDYQNDLDLQSTVILAGSFNPPHRGHVAMLEYLAERYYQVIIVVGMNPKKQYEVSPADRGMLLRKIDLPPNVKTRVVSGYIWKFGKKHNCKAFYRGIRSYEQDGRDERKLQIQNTWGPIFLGWTLPIPTFFLEGRPKYNHISSTMIRELCSRSGSRNSAVDKELAALVPDEIVADVKKLYTQS